MLSGKYQCLNTTPVCSWIKTPLETSHTFKTVLLFRRLTLQYTTHVFQPRGNSAPLAVRRQHRTSLFFVVMYLAPMALMIVLNGMLLSALRRSHRRRVTTLRFHTGSLRASATNRRRRRLSAYRPDQQRTAGSVSVSHHLIHRL